PLVRLPSLSLPDALPISFDPGRAARPGSGSREAAEPRLAPCDDQARFRPIFRLSVVVVLLADVDVVVEGVVVVVFDERDRVVVLDRKSTRLNSSHVKISY